MSSPLRKLLEEEGGWEEFEMILPHPFLPPRFQNLSNRRNMILLLDRDFTLHVRWEGARMHEHHPLTPRAARQVVREVLERMAKYRRDLQIFSRFVEQRGEQPFDDERSPDPIRWKEQELPAAEKVDEQEVVAVVEIEETLEAERLLGRGGETPMPDWVESTHE